MISSFAGWFIRELASLAYTLTAYTSPLTQSPRAPFFSSRRRPSPFLYPMYRPFPLRRSLLVVCLHSLSCLSFFFVYKLDPLPTWSSILSSQSPITSQQDWPEPPSPLQRSEKPTRYTRETQKRRKERIPTTIVGP